MCEHENLSRSGDKDGQPSLVYTERRIDKMPLKMAIYLNFELGEKIILMHSRDLPFPLKPWRAQFMNIMTQTYQLHLTT
jgi:hypothetical protein